jgi:LmbE family N-acetylglucosaminyl deacetylase
MFSNVTRLNEKIIEMKNIILVVAAHPDDEVLGCGGTIARYAAAGDDVNILIVAEGATSRDDTNSEMVAALKQCAAKAALMLGAKPPIMLGLPDNRLDSMDRLDVIKAIERHIEEIGPNTVYTHHGGDLNIDHRIVYEAVITACRPVPGSSVRQIFSFETVSSTEWATPSIGHAFSANHYVQISDQMETKIRAIQAYETEMRPFPHARSLESVKTVARLRGSQVGVEEAEAFQTELEIVD